MAKARLHLGRTLGASVHPARLFVVCTSLALVLGSTGPSAAQLREEGPPAPELLLHYGDFVSATASARSPTTLRLVQPDGSVLRTCCTASGPSKTSGESILDNLRADGRIPPVVAVFVTQVNRARELACNEDFATLIAGELIPWAQRRYHAGKSASDVVVGGSSFGGPAAG